MVPVKQEKSSAETVDDKHFQSLTPSLNENHVTKFVKDQINHTPVSKNAAGRCGTSEAREQLPIM